MDHHIIAIVVLLLGGGVFFSLVALLNGYRALRDYVERILSPE
jgi:hypothetical protein